MQKLFIEAESFNDLGGWVIDQQSTLQMGSPYVMAHGLGVPVKDAQTNFCVEQTEKFNVWVRTRDWTSPWGDLKAGKFQLVIDKKVLPTILGTNAGDWKWVNAGQIKLKKGEHTIKLHDLTGFNSRCDAVYITSCGDVPPNDKFELANFRKEMVSKDLETDQNQYDLVVVGGGIAGICTALASSRSGQNVLLIHDREILGGCNSSEIRVCLGGMINLPPYEKLGNMVKEIQPILGDPNIFDEKYFEDDRKRFAFDLLESKGKCKLALGEQVVLAKKEKDKIISVETICVKTGKRKEYKGKLFADCTGDAVLSRMVGAKVMYGREAKSEFNESLGADQHEKLVMGQSIRWYSEDTGKEESFTGFDTGKFLAEEDCLHVLNGDWEQESGFRRDMADETEYIRDYGLYMIFGNWHYQKNLSIKKQEYKNRKLVWASHLGGKRESYRVVGDLILTQNDIENQVVYDDATASITWSIDIHFPEATNEEKFTEAFRSFAYHRGIGKPYPVPYRCLYAKGIDNLFLGGRTISTTHVAFSAVRVMRTLGMLGEVVGLASVICKKYNCNPSDVYNKYLDEFKELLKSGAPSPSSFQGGINSNECFHFKDAGWIEHYEADKIETSSYSKKIKKNIEKLNLSYRYENAFKKK